MAALLPEDILEEEILPKLPAKSLVRFSSVCKRWHSLISDSKFIRKHFNSIHHQQKLVFKSDKNVLTFRSFSDDINHQYKFPLKAPLDFHLIGSVNGLLCLGYPSPNDFHIMLCNPFLKCYKKLPYSNFDSFSNSEVHLGTGFGYDSRLDDFKVVNVYREENKSNLYSVEIFLRKTNAWKTISLPLMHDVVNFDSFYKGICVSGFIYWIVYKCNYKSNVLAIMRFDLINENLKILEFPFNTGREMLMTTTLVDVAGVFGVIQTSYDTEKVRLWTIEEENVGKTIWRVKMEFDSHNLLVCVLNNGKVIAKSQHWDSNLNLFYFDDKTKNFVKIESAYYGNLGELQRSLYIETLVSPGIS